MDTAVSFNEILENLKRRVKECKLDGSKRSVRLLAIILCRPELTFAKQEIFPSLGHFHRRSKNNVDFYFAGFHEPDQSTFDKMTQFREGKLPWGFDEMAFIEFCREIESRCKWRYSGGCDFILVNYFFGSSEEPGLDLENAVTFSFERLQKQGKLVSASIFFENIFRHCESCSGQDGSWQIVKEGQPGNPLFTLCSNFLSTTPHSDNPHAIDTICEIGKLPEPKDLSSNKTNKLSKGPFQYDLGKRLIIVGKRSFVVPEHFAFVLNAMLKKADGSYSVRESRLGYLEIAIRFKSAKLRRKDPTLSDERIKDMIKVRLDQIKMEQKRIAQGYRRDFGDWLRDRCRINPDYFIVCLENENCYELGTGWKRDHPVIGDSEPGQLSIGKNIENMSGTADE
jgi:hypothetical protein